MSGSGDQGGRVADGIAAAGFADNHGHASIRNLVVEGRTVLTF